MSRIHPTITSIFRIPIRYCVCWALAAGATASASDVAFRLPLQVPRTQIEIAETGRDFMRMTPEGVEYLDSNARATFDEGTGTYTFNWVDPETDAKHRATWVPEWQVTCYVLAGVKKTPSERLRFDYTIVVDRNSLLPAGTLRLLALDRDAEILSPEGHMGRQTSATEIGDFLNVYWILKSDGKATGIAQGATRDGFGLVSDALPGPISCFVSGAAPPLTTHGAEVPYSVYRVVSHVAGFFKQHAKGLTVGPGPDRVDIQTIRQYLVISASQGWLNKESLLDKFDSLLVEAMAFEDAAEYAKTVARLSRILEIAEEFRASDPDVMTSEGFALIYYNTKWLSDHLHNLHKERHVRQENPD